MTDSDVSNERHRLDAIRRAIEEIVVPDGEDAGVLLLSSESPTHNVPGLGIVYNNEYFSDMGEALVKLWKLTTGFITQ